MEVIVTYRQGKSKTPRTTISRESRTITKKGLGYQDLGLRFCRGLDSIIFWSPYAFCDFKDLS